MKVYVRDKSGVMRAIPGVTIHNSTIFINKSVYTLARTDEFDWMFVIERTSKRDAD